MTRKQRAFVMEGAAIFVAGFLLAIVAPALVNMHDTFAAFAAFALVGLAIAWLAYFVYRNRDL